jgi:uncharacterized protein
MAKNTILTLDDFIKELNEDFFNPFDEENKLKNQKPKHVQDYGGDFKQRKETFNLGRVEYSKRPGGDYTITGKTQFAKGEIIEICPVVLVGEIVKTIDKLKDIVFEIDKAKDQWGLVLGYGSLYRHSQTPNLDFAYNPRNRQMYFLTNRFIKVGEELTINYGDSYWSERTNFNTMAELPGVNSATEAKPKVEESEVQPNAFDNQQGQSTTLFARPNDKANPAVSGRPILGGGQS